MTNAYARKQEHAAKCLSDIFNEVIATYGSQTRQCRQHSDIQSSHSVETAEYTFRRRT